MYYFFSTNQKNFIMVKKVSYKLKFNDSFRFMSTSLSKLVKYLSGKLHNDKCTGCKSKLDYMLFKDNQLIFRCFECKKNYQKDFDKDLINRFANKTLINLFCY